jgi:hypothetical protein
MSETSILPTAADAGSAAPGAPTPYFDEEPGDDRRRLMIIGGIVAGVLVLVVGYLLLKGGGSSDDASGLVPHGTPHAVASPATQGGSGQAGSGSGQAASGGGNKAGTKLPKQSNRRLAKDPFKPLIADTGGSSGSSGTAGAGSGSTGTPTGTSTGTSTGTGTGTTTGTPTGTDTGVPAGSPTSIRLVSVEAGASGAPTATFAITYRSHQVAKFTGIVAPAPGSKTGTVFANDFALLGIQGHVVTIQFGDDTPFDLKKGVNHIL